MKTLKTKTMAQQKKLRPAPVGKTDFQRQPTESQKRGIMLRYPDDDLNFFREIIEDKLTLAKKEYNELTGVNYDDNPKDSGEKSQDDESRDLNSRLAKRQKKFIFDLENALVRIEQKTFGICKATGKLIPKERLLMVPHATMCVEAKKDRDK